MLEAEYDAVHPEHRGHRDCQPHQREELLAVSRHVAYEQQTPRRRYGTGQEHIAKQIQRQERIEVPRYAGNETIANEDWHAENDESPRTERHRRLKLRRKDVIGTRWRTEQKPRFGTREQARVENNAGGENQHRAEREKEQIKERFDNGPLEGNLVHGQFVEQIQTDAERERRNDRARCQHRKQPDTSALDRSAQVVAEKPHPQPTEDRALIGNRGMFSAHIGVSLRAVAGSPMR